MRIVWVGFHEEGVPALRAVVAAGHDVAAVITLTPEAAAKRSGTADYETVAGELHLPLHQVKNINEPSAVALLRELAPDLLVVLGWTQILRDEALAVPRLGVVGAHASLLPENRGRAPVNWAIIRGDTQGGNTLMWLSAGVDDGDIVDQRAFPIHLHDTCATVYGKVAETNEQMVLGLLDALARGERPSRPQPHSDAPLLPGRKPADGLIDWSQPAKAVYDLVRGVTRPYPGAFTYLGDERVQVWNAALLPFDVQLGSPGECLGPMVSPEPGACGQAVACGRGAVVLLDVETGPGALSGSELQAQDWRGRVMGHG